MAPACLKPAGLPAVKEGITGQTSMSAHLKLVSDNPTPPLRIRPDGRALHRLADRLTEEIQAGHPELAQVVASFQHLSPFDVAIVATWMTKAGLSETEILEVVA
jgi:hypothetical protein